MAKFLDLDGLSYFWSKITAKFVAKETGKGLSTNDFTTALKTKVEDSASETYVDTAVGNIDNFKRFMVNDLNGSPFLIEARNNADLFVLVLDEGIEASQGTGDAPNFIVSLDLKTVNNQSLIGSGNINIQGSGEANVIENVSVNGVTGTISNKVASVTVDADDIPWQASGTGHISRATDVADALDFVNQLDIPTATSDLTNDSGFLASGDFKTINSQSIVGSGNIAISGLPSVSSSDNGKVLRVVNGAWSAVSLPSASGVSF